MKTYIISTDKGFKLLKELPEEPNQCIPDDSPPCPKNEWIEKEHRYVCLCRKQQIDYNEAVQQAIDSAPFVKNADVALSLVYSVISKDVARLYPKQDHPYEVNISGYDVSKPECGNFPCDGKNCKLFVTLTPKAVENKEDLIRFVNDMKTTQTLKNGCDVETIHIPSLLHKIKEISQTMTEKEKRMAEALRSCQVILKDHGYPVMNLVIDQILGEDESSLHLPSEKSSATENSAHSFTEGSDYFDEGGKVKFPRENSAQVESQTDYILDLIVTFNLSTSFQSIEEAKEELPKLFQSKRESAKKWLETIVRKGEA